MRVAAIHVLVLAGCATAPVDEFSGEGRLPYGAAGHEAAWQALCRVSTREAGGAPLRVDSSAWEIRCGDKFLCRAPPGGDAVEVRFNSDLDWYLRFASRFHDALAGRG